MLVNMVSFTFIIYFPIFLIFKATLPIGRFLYKFPCKQWRLIWLHPKNGVARVITKKELNILTMYLSV